MEHSPKTPAPIPTDKRPTSKTPTPSDSPTLTKQPYTWAPWFKRLVWSAILALTILLFYHVKWSTIFKKLIWMAVGHIVFSILDWYFFPLPSYEGQAGERKDEVERGRVELKPYEMLTFPRKDDVVVKEE